VEAERRKEIIEAVKVCTGERQTGPEFCIPYGHKVFVKATGFLERFFAKERCLLDKDARSVSEMPETPLVTVDRPRQLT